MNDASGVGPDQPAARQPLWLPFDIVSRIIETYACQLTTDRYAILANASNLYAYPQVIIELLKLRLISKTWSQATIPVVFRTFHLRGSKGAQIILKNWKSSIYAPDLPCPVRRLILKDILYLGESDETSPRKAGLKEELPMFMDQATELIELIGETLNELTLTFIHSCGVSTSLIKAIKRIKHLKELNIMKIFSPVPLEREGVYDTKTLADLLFAIPKLETLNIQYIRLVDSPLRYPALSNLRNFSFRCNYPDPDGFNHICRTAKESLKVIEFNGIEDGTCEEAEQVFNTMKSTLEGLVTAKVSKNFPDHVINMEFPKLRFLQSGDVHHRDEQEITKLFLTWPMFYTIRTLALDISYGPAYLKEHMMQMGENPFYTAPHLRHIIFVLRWHGGGPKSVPSELVKALHSHGIKCHVSHGLKPAAVMDLDYKLNGPV